MRHPDTLILVCILLLAPLTGFSQSGSERLYDIGFKGGLALSSFHNADLPARINPGFVLGGFIRIPIDSSFAVQPELLFAMRGAKVTDNNIEFTLGLDYIELPMLVTYRWRNAGSVEPSMHAGPQLSFLVNNESNVTIDDDQSFTPDDMVEEARETVLNITAGFGLEINLGVRKIVLDIRYSSGLTNTFNDRVAGNIKNGSLMFMAGLVF